MKATGKQLMLKEIPPALLKDLLKDTQDWANLTISMAEKVVRIIDSVEEGFGKLLDTGKFERRILEGLERVGRNQLLPELFMEDESWKKRVAKMTLSMQRKCLNGPVPMVIIKEKGGKDVVEVLQMHMADMTQSQLDQVCNRGGLLRKESEQRAYIENKHALHLMPRSKPVEPWTIKGNKLHVEAPCTLTMKDLLRILEKMD